MMWKSTLFIIFIVFICQKFRTIPLLIEKYNNAIVLRIIFIKYYYKIVFFALYSIYSIL